MSDQEHLERLRQHVEAALEYSGGTHNFEDIAEMVEDHRFSRMRPLIESWGKSVGCTRVTLAGRKGWAKTFLKDEGYSPQWAVLAKDL
jgi:hypothetical protein